ncbi:MAG: hypothetical protein M9894_02015 [Planctomycetes bacterium]|nr:hypothetical protein [Planctomycetota bacterium]
MDHAEDLEVRLATPDDAPEIAALMEAQYGGGYADPTYTDPAALRAKLAGGDVRYAVARAGGVHAGQMAVERCSRHLWEFARALVRPEVRNQGVLLALDQALLEQALRPDRAARFFFARSVTHHLVSQRHARRVGARALGLLLGLWPASALEGAAGAAPVSALLTGRPLAPMRARRLALEGRVRARAAAVLEGLGVDASRERLTAGPALGVARADVPALGLVHARVGARGRAPLVALPDDLARARDAGARVAWVDVPSEHPRAPAVVGALERAGFSFGAYLPFGGLAGEDVVRLQRHDGPALGPDTMRLLDDHLPLRDAVLADAALARVEQACA